MSDPLVSRNGNAIRDALTEAAASLNDCARRFSQLGQKNMAMWANERADEAREAVALVSGQFDPSGAGARAVRRHAEALRGLSDQPGQKGQPS